MPRLSRRPARIDGVGGSMVRGNIDDAADFKAGGFAPLGVLSGATLVRDVAVGEMVRYDDVQLVDTSTIVSLRRLQDQLYG